LAAVVHFAVSQYWGYADDYGYDTAGGLQLYDNEYSLVPVQVIPIYDDAPVYYHRESRGKKKKKGKKKKGKKGWGWVKHKHIWLKGN